MQIVIDIPEERYKDIQRIAWVQLEYHHFKTAEQIIANGTPLPKGHGRLIDADKTISKICGGSCGCHLEECGYDEPCYSVARINSAPTIIEADKAESEDDEDIPMEYFESGGI